MILCSGAFDGLHEGHVRYLQAARQWGGPLHVAIAPDSYIQTIKQREPYWTQRERAATVMALGCVDQVHLQEDDTPARIIRETRPKVFVKGPDWKGNLPGPVIEACVDVGTVIKYTETQGRHTREARG